MTRGVRCGGSSPPRQSLPLLDSLAFVVLDQLLRELDDLFEPS